MPRRWRGALILMGLSAVIAVAAAEVGVRWLVPVPDQFFEGDSVVGVRHIAGKTGRWASPEFDVRVRINRHGFRDRERTEAKATGTRRIVVLGDSMTEALQVPLETSFPAVLEARLGGGRAPVEVLNLGVSSTGTGQQYLLFRERGRRYAPDVVVLMFFTGNDFRNNSRALDGDPALPYPLVGADGRLARDADGAPRFSAARPGRPLRQFMREHLASYRFFAPHWRAVGPLAARLPGLSTRDANAQVSADEDASNGLYRHAPSPAWREAIDVTLELLADLEREVRRAGAALVVSVIPGPWEVSESWRRSRPPMTGPGWDVAHPERVLLETLRARGVPALSLREPLQRETEGGAEVFFAQDGHLNARGHDVVGRALAGALRERRLVD